MEIDVATQLVASPRRLPMRLAASAVLVMFLWTLCFPLISTGLESSPPMAFATLRAVIAGLILLAAAQLMHRPPIGRADHWRKTVLVGLTVTGLGFFGMFYGGGLVSPGLATVVANTQPLIAAMLAGIWLGEHLGRAQRFGLVFGFTGIVVIGVNGLQGFAQQGLGIAYILLGATGVAVGNVLLKSMADSVDAVRVMGWQLLVGSVPLALMVIVVDESVAISWNISFIISLITLSVFGTAVPFVLWVKLLKQADLSQLNAFTFLTPIFGILLGMTFFGEIFHAAIFGGTALSLLGIYLVSRPKVTDGGRSTPGSDRNVRSL